MVRWLLLSLVMLSGMGAARAQDATLPNTPVPALDLQRYVGTWH